MESSGKLASRVACCPVDDFQCESGFSGSHGGKTDLAATLLAVRRGDYETETFITQGLDDSVDLPVLVRMREGKPGGGKGPLISEQSSLTLATSNDQVLFHEDNATSATGDVTHALTASSSKGATEDGTGRGVPIVSQQSDVWPDQIGTLTTAFDGKNYSNIQEVLSGSVILSEGPTEDE